MAVVVVHVGLVVLIFIVLSATVVVVIAGGVVGSLSWLGQILEAYILRCC